MRLKAGITVDSLEQNKINDVRKKWVQILHRVVDMIRFLSISLVGWLVGFLTSSSTTRLYCGRAPRQSV